MDNSRYKVLVVEDDAFLRELYVDTLKAEGYQIDSAEDGFIASEKIRQGGWDLVLLDIIIPKINGLDVMKQLASNPPVQPNKCVVFLTNLDKGEEIKEALQLGNGYLIKSQITPGDLVNEVRNYLAGSKTSVPPVSDSPTIQPPAEPAQQVPSVSPASEPVPNSNSVPPAAPEPSDSPKQEA